MNIFEVLSFDIGEFVTSIPGMLIIAGIVLLVIALIILSGGKKKGTEAETATAEVSSAPSDDVVTAMPEASATVMAPEVFDSTVEKGLTDMSNVGEVPAPVVAPNVEVAPVVVTGEQVSEPVSTEVAVNPTFAVPTAPALDVVAPEMPVTPAVEPVLPVAEPASEVLVVEPEVVAPTPVVEEAPRPIYGGANPLENTAPVPVAEAREAYSGSVVAQSLPTMQPEASVAPAEEVKIVEEPAAPAVSEAPVAAANEIETLDF